MTINVGDTVTHAKSGWVGTVCAVYFGAVDVWGWATEYDRSVGRAPRFNSFMAKGCEVRS